MPVGTAGARTRISLRTILYATDFSPAAEDAGLFASELARRYESRVLALHVRPPQVYEFAPPESWPALNEASDQLADEQARHMKSLFHGVKHEILIGEGNIWKVVSALIKEKDVDLIVIGTHGRRGLGMILVGSVAEKILRRATCPVVTVGPHVQPEPVHTARLEQILCATDFSKASAAGTAYAVFLAQASQAKLDLVHVIEHPKPAEAVRCHELAEPNMQRLRDLVPADLGLASQVSFLVELGDPAEQILRTSKSLRADLIVLGVKHTGDDLSASTHLPWLTAHRVISEAPCPVLTVRG
jgi:nucleotide-binding universal stress UspA family protein